MYDVVALGELLIDFAPIGADDSGYPKLAAKPGGAPTNYLAALTKYGGKTALYAKVGTDAFGKLLVRTIADTGIDTAGIVSDDSVFTTLAFVTLGASGERSFSFARKPGADTCLAFEELNLSLIDNAKMFHYGTLSLTNQPAKEATQKAVEYAKKTGKLITFDPNLRESLWADLSDAKEQILWGLREADVVKISDDEVDFLWGKNPEDGAAMLLEKFNVKLAMVTGGSRGALVRNNNAKASTCCPAVKPVDTTGAGDIFTGAAISRLLKFGKAPENLNESELSEMVKFAVTAASLSTQTLGAIPSIPEEKDVLEKMKSLPDCLSCV
ncbi:MAG: carbohydrate kinase [Oscillospiraceae bacterium]|nr:carbohydrate kinase [Oscillospiraceae bacterium]MCL2279736.1 carbohydrate kinase [Oscillospiraceae bacterium]